MDYKLDLAKLLGEIISKDKVEPLSIRDSLPDFTREVYLFGKYDPKDVGNRIDFNGMNRKCVQAISGLGFELAQIPIREGSDEEIGDDMGRYIKGTEIDEILLSRRYYCPGSESWEKAESNDQEFLHGHWNQKYPESWRDDHLARLSHMVEDIVVHEYGHKVYRENFQEEVVRRSLETVFADKRSQEIYRTLVLVYSSDTEEGFARWLNFAVVGHEHPADIADLVMFSSQELRAEGKKPYNDRKAIADFYRLLKRTSDEHSIEYVIQNLPSLALDFIKRKHEQKEKERAEETRKFGLQFKKYIT